MPIMDALAVILVGYPAASAMNAARVSARDTCFILDPFDLLLALALQSASTPITTMGGIDPWI